MKYKIGQSVKVKQGVKCPDNLDFDLSGWQGRIIDFDKEGYKPTIGIEFDSITLKEMPKAYIENCEKEGLSWSEIYLYEREVEPTHSRDSEEDVAHITDELETRFGWIGIGPEGELIQSVVNLAASFNEWDVMNAWGEYLEKKLQFPFETVISEYQERGPLSQGDTLIVLSISLLDELDGIIVTCKKGRKQHGFPLADLKVIEKNSINAELVQAYCTWFANK